MDNEINIKEYLTKLAPDFSIFDVIESAFYTGNLNEKSFPGLIYIRDGINFTETVDTGLRRGIFRLICSQDNFRPYKAVGGISQPYDGENAPYFDNLYDYYLEHSDITVENASKIKKQYKLIQNATLNDDYFMFEYRGDLIIICDLMDRISSDNKTQPTIIFNVGGPITDNQYLTPSNLISQIIGVGF